MDVKKLLFSHRIRLQFKAIPIPDQIKRLLVVVLILAAVFLVIRQYLIPKGFGEYGHYRPAAIDSVLAQDIKYAGHQVCIECHDDYR